MEKILNANNFITGLLGNQVFSKDTSYRWLHYCVFLECNNCLLILNNLTRELVAFEKTEYIVLNDGTYSVEEYKSFLIEKWFMVPMNFEEKKLSNQIRSLARHLDHNRKNITFYDILTTTACNARCFYCFEAGSKKSSMTQETAKRVADYIMAHCNGKPVELYWFGGEPLCNIPPIDTICQILSENDVQYTSSMVSNSYLFDDSIVSRAVSLWKLKYVQVTLDGLENTYNRVKNYVYNDSNPFKMVINNIEKLLKNGILARVRLNMDQYNEQELYSLVDYLADKFAKYQNFSIYSNIIFENEGYVKSKRTESQKTILGKKHLALQEYIRDKGLLKMKPVSQDIAMYACMADNDAKVLISPDGMLGNCEHHVDDDFFGDIFSDSPIQSWNEYKADLPECDTCSVYPTCIIPNKCHPERQKCDAAEKERKLWDVQESMRVTYNKFLKEKFNPKKEN